MNKDILKKNLREIPDFPIPGILFYDVTTLFKNAECLQSMLDDLYNKYKDKGITKVIGIESRGFILGGALAARLNAGFIMARKPGKLPAEVIEETYAKEYGTDTIQIHKDAIAPDDVVLLHDDLLATGGTMAAAYRLVKKCGVEKAYINFVIELVLSLLQKHRSYPMLDCNEHTRVQYTTRCPHKPSLHGHQLNPSLNYRTAYIETA